ncbi:MAG: hypothetical protein ACK4YP_18765 [Myxococcota bacterium]
MSMRFNASPLMVAVALGLLGPSVLEVEEEGLEERGLPEDDAASELDAAVEAAD